MFFFIDTWKYIDIKLRHLLKYFHRVDKQYTDLLNKLKLCNVKSSNQSEEIGKLSILFIQSTLYKYNGNYLEKIYMYFFKKLFINVYPLC
jgi:hypothetical protein